MKRYNFHIYTFTYISGSERSIANRQQVTIEASEETCVNQYQMIKYILNANDFFIAYCVPRCYQKHTNLTKIPITMAYYQTKATRQK